MYGGLFGSVLAGSLFLWRKKVSVLRVADIVAPNVGLGIFLTRIGCFLNGCCFGTCTNLPWGLNFPESSPAGHFQSQLHCEAIHPSQLYASFGGIVIFFVLRWLHNYKRFNGHTFFLLLAFYSTMRFFVDATRHYTPDEKVLGLSHNQVFCVLLIVLAASAWAWSYKRATSSQSSPPGPSSPDLPSEA